MGKGCAYINCKLNKRKLPGIRLFRFPVNDPDRLKKWIANSGNPDLATLSLDHLINKVVCSEHFNRSDILGTKLTTCAIPRPYSNDNDNSTTIRTYSNKCSCVAKEEAKKCESTPRRLSSSVSEPENNVKASNDIPVKPAEIEHQVNTMPKKKETLVHRQTINDTATRKSYRRQASKHALEQMHKINEMNKLDSPEVLEIPSDDDYENQLHAVDRDKTKKKYKPTPKKNEDTRTANEKRISYENDSLLLDSWVDELSPAQIAMKNKIRSEIKDINTKLETLISETKSEIIFQGDNSALYEFVQDLKGKVVKKGPSTAQVVSTNSKVLNSASFTPIASTSQISQIPTQLNKRLLDQTNTMQLVMDPRSGVVVGTMTPTTTTLTQTHTQQIQQQQQQTPQTRKRTMRGPASLMAPSAKMPKLTPIQTIVANAPLTIVPINKVAESTAIGGLIHNSNVTKQTAPVVDLTADEGGKHVADSKEVSFNKLQGKTYPSLVVVARPHLRVNDSVNDRGELDSKVKSLLMQHASKFSEWLLQIGLIRSEQFCSNHPGNKLKLGMYSDVQKFPYSGGFVWISECCPQRFISVFCGSIFEMAPHPPTVLLKLIYHWACQTNTQNVVQWVKVDNLYVKGFYTLLRAVCTSALHTHVGLMGGPRQKVEVGVISLGTTSQDGTQRQVKVEVLGVLDPEEKLIRLRAVEPVVDGERNYKKRFSKILEPLSGWIHQDSVIVTDFTVDKGTLHSLGFDYVIQSGEISNRGIMEYLRRIVPRMFQNTLSLLSRQIIQQFLDELVWREWFGSSPGLAFDNIIRHVAEQTKLYGDYSSNFLRSECEFVQHLQKVANNPFKNWSMKQQQPPPPPPPPSAVSNENVKKAKPKTKTTANVTAADKEKQNESGKPRKATSPDIPEQMVPVEHYYYGNLGGFRSKKEIVNLKMKCTICRATFTNNISLMLHLFTHIHSNYLGYQCRYCLATMQSKDTLSNHIATSHPTETKTGENFVCLICCAVFYTTYTLGKHMSREHAPSELPYQCATCSHRCSSHKNIIDHFYLDHDGGNMIQCPFCLKTFMLTLATGKHLTHNVNNFLQHLQKHQKKLLPKKCPKCCLWFIQKELVKDHLARMHTSQRRKAGLMPWPVPRNGVMVPKSRQEEPCDDANVDISRLNINNTSEDAKCLECNFNILAKNHFPSLQNCTNDNCQYTTCCKSAMTRHIQNCHDFHIHTPVEPLPFRMYCVCGYSNVDGNLLAKHLAVCERKSAYPSEESAKSATVTHSMLDVLGLMRRPEEPSQSDVVEIDDKSSSSPVPSTSKDADPSVDAIEIVDAVLENEEATETSHVNHEGAVESDEDTLSGEDSDKQNTAPQEGTT